MNDSMERSWFADRIARQPGFLQSLDARIKLIAGLILLIAVAVSHQASGIAFFLPIALLCAAISRIPILVFIRRVWALVFLFSGVVALPAIFLTPGPVLLAITPFLRMTQTGIQSAEFLILRSSASVSLATLMVLTTPWNSLLQSLGVLKVPDVILLVLAMAYRYIHLLLHTTHDMFVSRKSRILKKMDPALERKLLGATGGVLLGKSLQLSSDVYFAMESRGFRGYPRTLDSMRLHLRDGMTLFLAIFFSVIILHGLSF
jgi:cobalt/nickel transport system permease protein